MIIYSPNDGEAYTSSVKSKPKHCFLMTRLGQPIPSMVDEIRDAVEKGCSEINYQVIDANKSVTGRDFLLKIWRLIASAPIAIGVLHEDMPQTTMTNIFYELGVAQALGKETIIIKSPNYSIPSDFVRTEYIEFNDQFEKTFKIYLSGLSEQAEFYEVLADQLDRNPILAIDYLKRAYLITGHEHLREKAKKLLEEAGLEGRAKNSVEILAGNF